ncbi:hypothetical protein Golob_007528, partial [Gossypium lobatum]|nr:hypothetical protein [Gossypium lobatum]
MEVVRKKGQEGREFGFWVFPTSMVPKAAANRPPNVYPKLSLKTRQYSLEVLITIEGLICNPVVPHEYGIAGGMDGEDLIRLVEKVLQEVLIEKISSALWKRLETLYATKSLANRLVLKQRLFTFRINEDKISFEDVKGHFLSRDKLDNEFGSNSKANTQAFVLVASKKRDKMCHYCKNLGHVKADFYKLRNKRATESNEEDVIGANLADESNDDFLLVPTSNNSKLTFEWILDLGCSFHMCPNRERIYDGTIRILSDVKYVPDLRKNLIFLSKKSSLHILEGSTVTSEIGRLSSITESKSTRLERRQLGHRTKK